MWGHSRHTCILSGNGGSSFGARGVFSGPIAPLQNNGCQPISDDLSDKIALIERGGCNFADKARNAQYAGAQAVLIYNNDESDPNGLMEMGGEGMNITIPAHFLSYRDGNAFADSSEEVWVSLVS